jgi:peroxiredoxin
MSKTHSVARRRQQKEQQAKQQKIIMMAAAGLAIVLLGVLLWSGLGTSGTQTVPVLIEPGQPAPNFELMTLAGETAVLEEYAGNVVLINFWATWCPPCKAEMPAINTYYEANRENGLTVLAVNAQEDRSTVSKFIKANGFTFPILFDNVGDVATQFQVHSYPTSIIVDRDGVIQAVHNGLITPEQLEEVVTPLLSS